MPPNRPRNPTGFLLFAICALVFTACGRDVPQPSTDERGSSPAPAPRPTAAAMPAPTFRGDCRRMCKRTFLECAAEVLTLSGALSGVLVGRIKQAGRWDKFRKRGHAACLEACLKKRGFGKTAPAVRNCLRAKSCGDYARCIKPYVK